MPLNHVALTVTDRERSAEFYGRQFGLTERVHDDEDLLILGDSHGSLLALMNGPRGRPGHAAVGGGPETAPARRGPGGYGRLYPGA